MTAENNLVLTLRERGKLVRRIESHNVWLNTGRKCLAELLCYSSYSPLTPVRSDRPLYMGLGVGGTRQSNTAVSEVPPISTHYPGTRTYLDYDVSLLRLERPARISWSGAATTPSGAYPTLTYAPGDVFLKRFDSIDTPTTTSRRFMCQFSTTDFNGADFLAVPLSEVGLFLSGASVNDYAAAPAAYDTFDTLTKTTFFDMLVEWTLRF